MVLAETRAQAVDAAEAVLVDYDPLPAVVDPLAALEDGAPLLFPSTARTWRSRHDYPRDEGALEDAEIVVSERFVNQRVAPVPMEPNGILAVPDAETGGLTAAGSRVQAPLLGAARRSSERLGLEKGQVRVIAPAVGGGFGAKVGDVPGAVRGRGAGRSPRPARALRRDPLGEHGGDDARPRAGAGRASSARSATGPSPG